MTTTDKNKLLAEFMGVFDNIKQIDNNYYWSDSPFYFTSESIKEKVIENICNYVKYDTDWNWLMDVVQKIESLDIYYDKYIDYNSSMFTSGKIELSTNIDNVYKACVSFVQWYNEQNNIGA
jgi:hypothetical protein